MKTLSTKVQNELINFLNKLEGAGVDISADKEYFLEQLRQKRVRRIKAAEGDDIPSNNLMDN